MFTWEDVEKVEKGAQEYIEWLDSLPPEDAEKRASESLIRSGILNEDGSPKQQIVNGNFFGW